MPYKVLGPHNTKQRTLDFSLYDVAAGINIKASPQEIADNELTIGTNGYLIDDGAFYGRFGTTKHGASFSSSPTWGMIRFFQTVVNATPQTPFVRFTLAQSGGHLINVETGHDYGAITSSGNGQPWTSVQMYDPNHPGGASDVLVICTGSGGPYIFDGTTIYTPANWTTNIPGAQFVTLINGILWFSGVAGQPNLVFGSQLLAPENIPFYNEINVSRTVMGLGVIGAGAQAALAVGMSLGVSLVVGSGSQNFTVVELPSEDGVTSYRSMITVDGILYYQGQVAMYRCDGYTITPISNKVEPWILNDPTHQEFPMNGDRALSWSFYYKRRIYFWYDSGNVGFTNVALVFDLTRNGWTIYQGLPFMSGCILNAPNDPDPPVALVASATTGQAYNFETAVTTANLPQFQWPNSDDGADIFVQAQTKFFKLGDPGSPKTLLRAYPELFGVNARPSLGIATNYAAASLFSGINIGSGGSMVWGPPTVWGAPTTWSSKLLTFVNPRIDFNAQAEAFAFSMSSRDMNPPWKWVGLTGTFSQNGKM